MMPWINEYVGIPYLFAGATREGADCWGLARLVLREQFGKDLPDFERPDGDPHRLKDVVFESMPAVSAERIMDPCAGDLVLMRILGQPCHVGVALGGGYMLHTLFQHDSAIERFTDSRWIARLEGFYRVGN